MIIFRKKKINNSIKFYCLIIYVQDKKWLFEFFYGAIFYRLGECLIGDDQEFSF
jgi:hypothetical protein